MDTTPLVAKTVVPATVTSSAANTKEGPKASVATTESAERTTSEESRKEDGTLSSAANHDLNIGGRSLRPDRFHHHRCTEGGANIAKKERRRDIVRRNIIADADKISMRRRGEVVVLMEAKVTVQGTMGITVMVSLQQTS